MCARAQNCVFQQDRKVYCYKHRDLVSAKVWIQRLCLYFVVKSMFLLFSQVSLHLNLCSTSCGIFLPFQVVTGKGFEVPRRVYVDFEGINLRRKFLTGIEPESINMTIGRIILLLSGDVLSGGPLAIVYRDEICSISHWL